MFDESKLSPPRFGSAHPRLTTARGANPILLSCSRHFSRLSRDDLQQLADASECLFPPPAYRLYQQGEPAAHLFLLLDGEVSLEHHHADGAVYQRCISGPYDVFGDRVLLGESLRYCTAWTLRRSLVLSLPAGLVRSVLSAYSDVVSAWTADMLAGFRHLRARTKGATPVRHATPRGSNSHAA